MEELEEEGGGGRGPLVDELQTPREQPRGEREKGCAASATAAAAWEAERSNLRGQADRLRETVESLTKTLEEARDESAARDRSDQARGNLLKRAMKLEGKGWERKVVQGGPRFRQRS